MHGPPENHSLCFFAQTPGVQHSTQEIEALGLGQEDLLEIELGQHLFRPQSFGSPASSVGLVFPDLPPMFRAFLFGEGIKVLSV